MNDFSKLSPESANLIKVKDMSGTVTTNVEVGGETDLLRKDCEGKECCGENTLWDVNRKRCIPSK